MFRILVLSIFQSTLDQVTFQKLQNFEKTEHLTLNYCLTRPYLVATNRQPTSPLASHLRTSWFLKHEFVIRNVMKNISLFCHDGPTVGHVWATAVQSVAVIFQKNEKTTVDVGGKWIGRELARKTYLNICIIDYWANFLFIILNHRINLRL